MPASLAGILFLVDLTAIVFFQPESFRNKVPHYHHAKGDELMGVSGARTTIEANGVKVQGYLAKPDTETPSAAVIVIHEWYGLNKHIEDVAERYAREGYVALAVDLYDGVLTTDDNEAASLMSSLDQAKAVDYLEAAVTYLRGIPGIRKVGVTGFCMGGSFALLLPSEAQIDAAVPFYGDVPADTSFVERISSPVLFIGAEKDAWITADKLERLKAAFKQYKKDGEVKVYKDAPHAFFNDTRPNFYRPADAADAWKTALAFFSRHLS